MAPGLLLNEAIVAPDSGTIKTSTVKITPKHEDAPRSIFPDGIRTSGQHPPLYDKLRPYTDFPQTITGPTLWKKEDYETNPSSWIHIFTPPEITELSTAADTFLASGVPLTGITESLFPLPILSPTLHTLRATLLNGRGFALLRGLPTDAWGTHKSAVAYMGLGTHLGYFLSQNGLGHVLGHVKDVGDDAAQTHKVRIYRTAARQFFHTDDGDLVGLLCLHRAASGGESDVVSAHAVWNALQRENPDVAELLAQPVWYFDRKGEVSRGEEPWTRQPVFYLESGGLGRVYVKWDPYYVRSLGRFWDAGVLPRLTAEQERAVEVLQETCQRLALHMVLEVGDVQFVSNAQTLHARTAYTDLPPPAPRRHLLRLWLSTPETEGGWVLAMPDSGQKKRGGVQVDDTPPRAPLDAE